MTPFDAKARGETIAERMWGITFVNPRTVGQVKEMIVEALAEARAEALAENREILIETRKVLTECNMAIWVAVAGDDGLDGSEHDRLRPLIIKLKARIRRSLAAKGEITNEK